MDRQELYELLAVALNNRAEAPAVIKQFQAAIFDGSRESLGLNESEWAVFTQLAQDLDYYEPDSCLRREDPAFYGDDRVAAEIREALEKLHVSTQS